MDRFFKSRRFKAFICVFAALLAGAVFAAVASSGSSPLTNAAGVVFSPLQKVSAIISDKVKNVRGAFVSASSYREEISRLNEELDEKNGELVDYERTKQKLASYEEFLEIKESNPDYVFCPATVISRSATDIYNSFTVDKGTADGVKVNDPVIYGSCVVGVVKEVTLTSSVVKTVLDPGLNISVYEIKTRESGYSATTSQLSFEGLCRMSGLTRSTAVCEGGIVCTSGLGGVFPRDLIVGTVTEIRDEENDVSSYAVIKPGVDILTVSDVFIITDFEGQNG